MYVRMLIVIMALVACSDRPRLNGPGGQCQKANECSTAICRQGICQEAFSSRLTADARPRSQTVAVGQIVQIIGSFSTGSGTLKYRWTLDRPADSDTQLDSTNQQSLTFVADVAGTYLIRLVVDDGFSESLAALVSVLAVIGEDSKTHRVAALIPAHRIGDESIFLAPSELLIETVISATESEPPLFTLQLKRFATSPGARMSVATNDPKRGYLLHETTASSTEKYDPPLIYWPLVLREGIPFSTYAKTAVTVEGRPAFGLVTHKLTHHGVKPCSLDDNTNFDKCHKIERIVRYTAGSVLARQEHTMTWLVEGLGIVKRATLGEGRTQIDGQLFYQLQKDKVVFGTRPKLKSTATLVSGDTVSITDSSRVDWKSIPPAWHDLNGDVELEYERVPGTDLKQISVAYDDTSIFTLITFHHGAPNKDFKYSFLLRPNIKAANTVTRPLVNVLITHNELTWTATLQCSPTIGCIPGSICSDDIADDPSRCQGPIDVQVGTDFLELKIGREKLGSITDQEFALDAIVSPADSRQNDRVDRMRPGIELIFGG